MSEPQDPRPSEPSPPADPPTDPARTTSRRKRLGFRLGIAAAVVAIVVATLVFVSTRYPSTPEGVAEAYIDALREGDLDRMQALSCADLQPAFNNIEDRDEAGANLARMVEESQMEYSVVDITVDGDRAEDGRPCHEMSSASTAPRLPTPEPP